MNAKLALLPLCLGLLACSPSATAPPSDPSELRGEPLTANPQADDAGPSCPVQKAASVLLPEVTETERTLEYWLERTNQVTDLDEVLLDPTQLQNLHEAINQPTVGNALGQQQLLGPVDEARIQAQVQERLDWLYARFESAAYVEPDGSPFSRDQLDLFRVPDTLPPLQPQLHVTLDLTPVRCGPRNEPFYKPDLNLSFDRNGCSAAHPQEPIQLLATWPNGMHLARTRYTIGWIAADTPLSPPIPPQLASALVDAPRHRLTRNLDTHGLTLPADTLLAAAGPDRAYIGTPKGVTEIALPSDAFISGTRPLTRRALLTEAFSYLDDPYGFGGLGGGRDCSRFLLDVFASFGVQLPRHSANQARAGSFSIDVSELANEKERVALLDAASRKGIVLLQFPGHIMLYLGRNAVGEPMAIHAFAEYLEPCSEGTSNDAGETLLTVDRVNVSNLELGRDTSRTAFIQRLTRVTVLGKPPGVELAGIAQVRHAAPVRVPDTCDSGPLWVSPERPSSQAPLRLIASLRDDPGPAELTLIDPEGARHTPPPRILGGPPFSAVATLDAPAPGTWTAVYGDGRSVYACQTFEVTAERQATTRNASGGPFWEVRQEWDPEHENLYAAFVESLFDFPADQDLTWNNLHTLLDDPQRNLLYGHLGEDEESHLKLEPDCADLPYFLRAYFAWKMRLPMGYRSCSRGRAGKPPSCSEVKHNLNTRTKKSEVRAFLSFVNTRLRNEVHSASGRTHPDDDDTDYYPVPLTREHLLPGTLFADPYGHLLVITRWIPQGLNDYGILMAADAQPDGTVGRRRFWQGSFLFSADTTHVGAGFKAFRPLVRKGQTLAPLDNADLVGSRQHAPFSRQQYDAPSEDFYIAMEGLINPRPLDPFEMQRALVDALDESVARRVNSVQNGEDYKRSKKVPTIPMPSGHAIFETTGPWEAYSTPSRDMRLLISLDTVLGFPERVKRAPEQFALDTDVPLDEVVAELRRFLDAELAGRSFSYIRSDGSTWTLTLADVVARMPTFEMSYNPNDCVEVRWAAPEGSEERATCKRRAPKAQYKRMKKYRDWFATRTRPPR